MTITPGELLETSIAQVRTLAAFLGEQLDESVRGDDAQSMSQEVRACKDMLASLIALLHWSSPTRSHAFEPAHCSIESPKPCGFRSLPGTLNR